MLTGFEWPTLRAALQVNENIEEKPQLSDSRATELCGRNSGSQDLNLRTLPSS